MINKKILKSISKCPKCKTTSGLRFDIKHLYVISSLEIERIRVTCISCNAIGKNFYFKRPINKNVLIGTAKNWDKEKRDDKSYIIKD